jgi:hypothetical protein
MEVIGVDRYSQKRFLFLKEAQVGRTRWRTVLRWEINERAREGAGHCVFGMLRDGDPVVGLDGGLF